MIYLSSKPETDVYGYLPEVNLKHRTVSGVKISIPLLVLKSSDGNIDNVIDHLDQWVVEADSLLNTGKLDPERFYLLLSRIYFQAYA